MLGIIEIVPQRHGRVRDNLPRRTARPRRVSALRERVEMTTKDGGQEPPQRTMQSHVSWLDDVATGAANIFEVERAIEAALTTPTDSGPSIFVRHAAIAVAYRQDFSDGRHSFVPLMVSPETASSTEDGEPAERMRQPDNVLATWSEIVEATSHPFWTSRLRHLLSCCETEARKRVELARRAVPAYVALARLWRGTLDGCDALGAAMCIVRQFGLNALKNQVLEEAEASCRAIVDSVRPVPLGVVASLLRILAAESSYPKTVADIVLVVVNADRRPQLCDQFFGIWLSVCVDDAERRAVSERRVALWLDAAEAETGVRRAVFLQAAIECAGDAGLKELRDEATRRIQAMCLADFEMMGIRYGMVLRNEEVSEVIAPIINAPDLRSALGKLACFGPPSGIAAVNHAGAGEARLGNLFPTVRIGGDGLPRWEASSELDRVEYSQTEHVLLAIKLNVHFVAEALLRIAEKFGLPTVPELAAILEGPTTPPDLALAIAKSFGRFWAGDYEGAEFTVVPRIEAQVRRLLLAADVAIYRLQREQTPGQYPGLGWMLTRLQDHGLDQDWYRYLHTVLTNPVGMNHRNELSHGLVVDTSMLRAAMALQCALHLSILRGSPEVA
jgi:hypothetical protein